MPSGVYVIRNTINGRVYIGSAVLLRRRLSAHLSELRGGYHRNQKLQHAWNKYGEGAFAFAPLLICSREHRVMYEQRAIDAFDVVREGYNIAPLAGANTGLPSPRKGATLSAETREKIAAKLRGRPLSDSTRQKLRDLWASGHFDNRKSRSDRGSKKPHQGPAIALAKAVLSEDQVRSMRARRSGGETLIAISTSMGVCMSTVHRICTGDAYKWVA